MLKNFTLMVISLLFWGCNSEVVRKAAVIERDATLTCPTDTPNRCAIRSEFQDLADLTFAKPKSTSFAMPVESKRIFDRGGLPSH